MIIDTHTHFGKSGLSGWTVTENDLVTALDSNGVDKALVMPHAVTESFAKAHDAVAALCDANPRFHGLASLSPHLPEATYAAEIARCRRLGFVGIKLNTLQHLSSPVMAHSDRVFRAGAENGMPVIVHTGLGGPWAMPALIIPPAQRYPDLPIILAHAGFALYTEEALVAAQLCPNIYLEPSWCPVTAVRDFVAELGSERLMMGSDHPLNLSVELAKYRALDLDASELDNVLGRTATRVFPGLA